MSVPSPDLGKFRVQFPCCWFTLKVVLDLREKRRRPSPHKVSRVVRKMVVFNGGFKGEKVLLQQVVLVLIALLEKFY